MIRMHGFSNISAHSVSSDDTKVVLTARVRHTQAVSATTLRPWVAAERCGTIVCARCTCMAGLGEACSHIVALLCAAEAHTKMIKNTSCTSQPRARLSPNMVNINYAPIADNDFSTTIAKRKKMMEVSHSQSFDSFVLSP